MSLTSSCAMRAKRRVTRILRLLVLWLTPLALLTLLAPALPRGLLRSELEASIRKWIVRDSQGISYLLSPQVEQPGFSLRVSAGISPRSLDDFGIPLPLVPPVGALDPLFSTGMSLDDRDRLHLVWSTQSGLSGYALLRLPAYAGGPALSWHHPKTDAPGALVLAAHSSRVGDIARSCDGSVWVVWIESRADHEVSIHLGRVNEHGLVSQEMARGHGLFPPSLLLDDQGRFHLAWHDIYEQAYHASGLLNQVGAGKKPKVRRLQSQSFRPVLARTQGRLLAVYEDTYSHLKTILPEDTTQPPISLTRARPRFAWHTFHSQQIRLDRYGIAWLFFVDSARQHVFRTRWLGEDWGPIHRTAKLTWNSPRMEDNHLPIDRLAVEVENGKAAPGMGILLTHGPHQAFHSIPVPSLDASPGKKVLFLDLAEIQNLKGLELELNQAQKDRDNPVIEAGAAGDPDVHGAGNFLRVLKEKNIYRMWYSAFRRDRDRPWWEWYQVGYAESQDGYDFEKKGLIRNTPYVPMVLKDPQDPDPKRRYKLLKFPTHGSRAQAARAGRYEPWQETNTGSLSVSPDGIEWTSQPAKMLFPGGRPFSLMPQSLLFDPDERDPGKRYKTYGFSALNLARRGGGYAYSPDGMNWTSHPQNPMLDPFARTIPVVRGGKIEQIHDWVVWKDGDYYLSFYQYQHNGRELDLELAVSRDGENFVFIQPGKKVVPSGLANAWDCDHIAPSLPLLDEKDIKVYYGAICGEGEPHEKRSGGVAILRLDGYTHLQPQEGQSRGSFTTIPINPGQASDLFINADCGQGGHLEAELSDADSGEPLAGFSRTASVRFEGDSTSHRMMWKGDKDLSSIDRPFRIRFHLVGSRSFPRFYSFSFY